MNASKVQLQMKIHVYIVCIRTQGLNYMQCSCSNLISACLKARQVERALYWHAHMTKAEIEGDGVLHRSVLFVLFQDPLQTNLIEHRIKSGQHIYSIHLPTNEIQTPCRSRFTCASCQGFVHIRQAALIPHVEQNLLGYNCSALLQQLTDGLH